MTTDRDRILEQALKHELRATGTPPAGACLDAETLGAWTDEELAPAAMATVEAHIASCARCQELVGAMVRSTPGASVTSGTESTQGTQGTFSLWRWWLAPIAAGVTAVTLWMVVPEPPPLERAASESREAKAADAPSAEAVPPLAAEKEKAAFAEAPAAQSAERTRLDAVARDERQQQHKLTEERKEESLARRTQEQTTMADAAVPAAPPSPAMPPPPPATVALQAPAAAAESAAQSKERAAAPPVAALQKNAGSGFSPNVIEIPTLDPSLGWRITGARIERSDDGGKTWKLTRQDPTDGIIAGAAPSNSVGWFVGRAGRVLLTTNSGATFTDVSLAEPLELTVVAATDARNAMIYSSNGRRFRTDDGGRTWRPF